MKRVVGVIGTAALLSAVVLSAPKEVPEIATEVVTEVPTEIQIIETKQIDYLTDEELSLLYTCKPDIRKEDPNIVTLSQNDAWLLMQVARAEAGDDLLGELWSMRVIINRLYDERFPDSIKEIVSSTGQFEVYSTGSYKQAEINETTHYALACIEGGWNETDGAVYFESSSNGDDSWHKRNLDFVAEVNGQRYYK